MANMIATVETPEGSFDLATDLLNFSAMRCFAWGERTGRTAELYRAIAQELLGIEGPVALHGIGPFLEALLAAAPELAGKVPAIVDPLSTAAHYAGIPVCRDWLQLPASVGTVFLCEVRSEPRWRLRRAMEVRFRVLCPDLLERRSDLVPQVAWVPLQPSIYPIATPSLEIEPGLELLFLNLPARNNFALPLSLGYVHLALKRIPGLRFQTLDADTVLYHRYHIGRIFDRGGEPVLLGNGRPILQDPWEWNEECWMDPRLWSVLQELFAADIDELVSRLIQARPRVLAVSVHQRNEWITRYVVRRLKRAVPETVVVAGGHSCVSPTLGPQVFPEYDYMVIGEAEPVLSGLVGELRQGLVPKDLPGVVSKHDTPGRLFTPSTPPQDLDAIGAPSYDFVPDFALLRSWHGGLLPYLNLTRGCIWGRCNFCAERFPFRTRSAASFVDELEGLARLGLTQFNFSDSDFGGRPEVLEQVADEILRRGIKVRLNGQLRVHPRHEAALLKKLVAAGIGCNFGIDAMTPNTLKLQRKGYTIETVQKCLKNCREAGIKVEVNLVVGVPGETDQDVDDTIRFILEHREYITEVFNISPFYLMHGSIYWQEPERHGMVFLEQKEILYAKYAHGVPDRYWYSVGPYIDGAVRRKRALRIMTELRSHGVPVSYFAENSILLPMFQGFQNLRDLNSELPSLGCDAAPSLPPAPLPLYDHLKERTVVELSGRWLAFRNKDLGVLQRASGTINLHH